MKKILIVQQQVDNIAANKTQNSDENQTDVEHQCNELEKHES